MKFPDGTRFYPDIQDGVSGYNTSEERGADTFHPFRREPLIETDYGKSYAVGSEQSFIADRDGTLIALTPWVGDEYGYDTRRAVSINGSPVDIFTKENTIAQKHIYDYTGFWIAKYPIKKGDVVSYKSYISQYSWCCAFIVV